jgi:hypothetical protein
MGFRFRRTLKILPGLRLNISRSGVSATAGVRGASVTLGKKGTYANVGLPGSGLSYRSKIGDGLDGASDAQHGEERAARAKTSSVLPVLVIAALLIGGGVVAFTVLQKHPEPAAVAPVAAAPIAAPEPQRDSVSITKRSATIRTEPSRKAGKLGVAHQGDAFTVFARKGVWLQIGHASPEGWITASATAQP